MEDSFKDYRGLWYSPYMTIYSIGGFDRIMELSTYPRAERRTVIKTVIADGTEPKEYDEEGEVIEYYREGEEISWPETTWVEIDSDLITSADVHRFLLEAEALIGELCWVEIEEAFISGRGGNWREVDPETVQKWIDRLSEGAIDVTKRTQDPDKVLLRIRYRRLFR